MPDGAFMTHLLGELHLLTLWLTYMEVPCSDFRNSQFSLGLDLIFYLGDNYYLGTLVHVHHLKTCCLQV